MPMSALPMFLTLTVDGLAAVLRCQPEKVYRLAARGEFPPTRSKAGACSTRRRSCAGSTRSLWGKEIRFGLAARVVVV